MSTSVDAGGSTSPNSQTLLTLEEYSGDLLRRLWITKGIRFEANRRLKKQHSATHLAISILSVYVISAALLELLVKSQSAASHYLFPLATIAAPVFILVLEKHLAGEDYLVRAERMERSAQRVQHLHSRLQFAVACGKATEPFIDSIRADYEEVLRDFMANHDNIDYYYFQALHPERFPTSTWLSSSKRALRGRFLYYLDVWGIPLLLIVVPGVMIVVALTSVLPIGTK